MIVGFTGTRKALTCPQHKSLCVWLRDRPIAEFHHGCCIGADMEASEAVMAVCSSGVQRHAHIPKSWLYLSHSAMGEADVLHKAKDFLDRNKDIVLASEILLACPHGPETWRSGTWSTVRFARLQKKPIIIFWPDGKVSREGSKPKDSA